MLGAVLDETWTIYTRFFLRFFVIALIVFAVVNLAYALFASAVDAESGGGIVLTGLVAFVVTIVGGMWLTGALVHAVVDARDGELSTSVGEAFARARPFIGVLILASLLAALGILGGLILLIVPGVILMVRWSLVAQVVVLEGRRPKAALGRSNDVVRGDSWPVLALIVIVAVLGAIASGLLQAAFSAFPTFVEVVLGQTIANAVVQPFSVIALTLAFLRLREVRDGAVGVETTASPATADPQTSAPDLAPAGSPDREADVPAETPPQPAREPDTPPAPPPGSQP